MVDVKKEHFNMARDWIQQFQVPIRSLDALHLAIAMLDCQLLVTSGFNLKKSAEFFGIEVKYF
ncbi:PIN domain-containing protein [Calditrichota bacterium GD2]